MAKLPTEQCDNSSAAAAPVRREPWPPPRPADRRQTTPGDQGLRRVELRLAGAGEASSGRAGGLQGMFAASRRRSRSDWARPGATATSPAAHNISGPRFSARHLRNPQRGSAQRHRAGLVVATPPGHCTSSARGSPPPSLPISLRVNYPRASAAAEIAGAAVGGGGGKRRRAVALTSSFPGRSPARGRPTPRASSAPPRSR